MKFIKAKMKEKKNKWILPTDDVVHLQTLFSVPYFLLLLVKRFQKMKWRKGMFYIKNHILYSRKFGIPYTASKMDLHISFILYYSTL